MLRFGQSFAVFFMKDDLPIQDRFVCPNDKLESFVDRLEISVCNEYLTKLGIGVQRASHVILPQSRGFCLSGG